MLIYLIQTDDSLAAELTAECVDVGYTVTRIVAADSESVRDVGDARPDAILVSLEGDHAASLELAAELTTRRRLRGVALVFCGGTQAALTLAQDAYPRASFSRRDVLLNVIASLKS